MQSPEPSRSDPDRLPIELLASRLVLLLSQLAVAGALVWFVIVAIGMRGRISLPAWTIPTAAIFSAGLALTLIVRSATLARSLFRRREGR